MKTIFSISYGFIILFVVLFQTSCDYLPNVGSMFGNEAVSIDLIPFKSGDKWGYINKEGKILINPQFSIANPFIDGVATVAGSDYKFGLIDKNGKYIVNPQYSKGLPFNNGLALVVPENGKPIFINKNGDIKITVQSGEFVGQIFDGLAKVKVGDKWGYINDKGEMVITPQFDMASSFYEGLAKVYRKNENTNEGSYGYINTKGELVINYQFVQASSFRDGKAIVFNGKSYGVIDNKGKFIVNPQFDRIAAFSSGMAGIRQGDLWGFINEGGKIVINPQFVSVQEFSSNGYAAVMGTDGRWGFIDKDGRYLINPQFEYTTNFFGNIAFVQSGSKFGIIDKKGKFIVNPQFDEISIQEINEWRDQTVESDFFEMTPIVNALLEGTNKSKILGFDLRNTFKDIKAKYPNDNNNVSYNYNWVTYFLNKEINKHAKLSTIEFLFDRSIQENKPVYKTVQRYNYWSGYYNEKVVDRYEYSYNEDVNFIGAKVKIILSGKGSSKSGDIFIKCKESLLQIVNDIELISETDFNAKFRNNKSNSIYIIWYDRNGIYSNFYFDTAS